MPHISDEKRSLFQSYAWEFEKRYLLEKNGQYHQSLYKKERAEVKQYWAEIKKAKQRGENITDMVLEKFLPYTNSQHNREKGYRISVAPAITRDVRKWFENAGWQKPDQWDAVAQALYTLVYKLIEKGDWQSLIEFEKNQKVSIGIKAGFITPTLYFLNPQCRIINSKTTRTINYLFHERVIRRDLTGYKQYVAIIDTALSDLGIPLLQDKDVFDAFCHWMCDKRLGGYARFGVKSGLDEKNVEVDEEDETVLPIEEENSEPQGHWEAIYYIVAIGNLLGYKTYVADPSREAFGKKLKEMATLKEVPPILKSAPHIEKVDAIWYKHTPPFFFFEVEDGGTMREALHRLYNSMAYDARFFIVCPEHNRSKFEKWVTTAPFKEFEERYNFRTYAELFDFYKQAKQFTSMRERFLRL